MAIIDIKRFTLSLPATDNKNTEFEFHPVNIHIKQLYQVYTLYNGDRVR